MGGNFFLRGFLSSNHRHSSRFLLFTQLTSLRLAREARRWTLRGEGFIQGFFRLCIALTDKGETDKKKTVSRKISPRRFHTQTITPRFFFWVYTLCCFLLSSGCSGWDHFFWLFFCQQDSGKYPLESVSIHETTRSGAELYLTAHRDILFFWTVHLILNAGI